MPFSLQSLNSSTLGNNDQLEDWHPSHTINVNDKTLKIMTSHRIVQKKLWNDTLCTATLVHNTNTRTLLNTNNQVIQFGLQVELTIMNGDKRCWKEQREGRSDTILSSIIRKYGALLRPLVHLFKQ